MRATHVLPLAFILGTACGSATPDTTPSKISDCPVVTMVVSPATLNLTIGDSAQLTAQPAGPPCGSPPPVPFVVFWRSANVAIAIVDSASGKVRAVGAGMTTAIATVVGADAYKGASAVTVNSR